MVAEHTSDAVLFEEEQSFRQPWLWTVMLAIFLLVAATFAGGLIFDPEKSGRVILPAAIFMLSWGGVLPFLYSLRLTVRVDPQHLHVRFFPLMRKDLPLADIACWEACTYRPLLEYGGWGLRYSLTRGWAYNVSGNKGVRLELVNGKPLLLGSQRADELAAAITRAKS